MASMSQAKFFIAAILCIASGSAGAESITLASTTSTDQSGLFAYLLPLFKQASGLDVKVAAAGQALDSPRRAMCSSSTISGRGEFITEGFGLRACARRSVTGPTVASARSESRNADPAAAIGSAACGTGRAEHGHRLQSMRADR